MNYYDSKYSCDEVEKEPITLLIIHKNKKILEQDILFWYKVKQEYNLL